MFWFISICVSLGLIDIVQAAPVSPHHRKRGQLPISTCEVQELGDVHSRNTFVKRDLGFQGRIGNNIFLSYGDQGQPGAWVWIGVEDAGALFEEYQRTGAKVRHKPTNYPWAYEMQVEDLDGNVLRIGSDSKKNEPTGEWLDMNGQRWVPLPDGDWKRTE